MNLSNNNLSDITELKNLVAPKLRILDLSNNNIENIDVFKELNFPLEELYLNGNKIEQIGIFVETKILQNLKILRLSNIVDNESNKDILSKKKESNKDFDYINKKNNDSIIKKQILNKNETLTFSLK